jgi:hypothetical protein
MTIGNGPGAAYRVLMPLRVAGAQLNLTVGDISGNEALIGEAMDRATAAGADVLLVPELAISGYPPEDLVLRRDFVSANIAALRRLARRSGELTSVVGFVDFASGPSSNAVDSEPREVANAAAVIAHGEARVITKSTSPISVSSTRPLFRVGTDPDRLWDIRGVPRVCPCAKTLAP